MGGVDVVSELSRWLDELARKWERFFARDPQVPAPPERERSALERRLIELSREESQGAAESFRSQQLLHRFSAYNQMWLRQLREREEARRARAALERTTNVPAPAPVPPRADGFDDLHTRYVVAMKASGKGAPMSKERFREALDKQRAVLEARGVVVEGFDVVEDGSQVKLRARLRRGRQ